MQSKFASKTGRRFSRNSEKSFSSPFERAHDSAASARQDLRKIREKLGKTHAHPLRTCHGSKKAAESKKLSNLHKIVMKGIIPKIGIIVILIILIVERCITCLIIEYLLMFAKVVSLQRSQKWFARRTARQTALRTGWSTSVSHHL